MCPHLEYSMQAFSLNQLERIKRFATRLVTVLRHLPSEEREQQLGLHSLYSRRVALKIFTGLLTVD